MRVYIEQNVGAVKARLTALQKDAGTAIARATNRTRDQGTTVAVRAMAADTGLTQKRIRESLSMTDADRENPVATLTVTGKRIPLLDFDARQTKAGVTYRLTRGGGRGAIKSAFIAQMKSGHRGVFLRKGKRRLPIQELFGPSLPRVATNETVSGAVRAKVAEVFPKNLDHEITFLASSLGLTA